MQQKSADALKSAQDHHAKVQELVKANPLATLTTDTYNFDECKASLTDEQRDIIGENPEFRKVQPRCKPFLDKNATERNKWIQQMIEAVTLKNPSKGCSTFSESEMKKINDYAEKCRKLENQVIVNINKAPLNETHKRMNITVFAPNKSEVVVQDYAQSTYNQAMQNFENLQSDGDFDLSGLTNAATKAKDAVKKVAEAAVSVASKTKDMVTGKTKTTPQSDQGSEESKSDDKEEEEGKGEMGNNETKKGAPSDKKETGSDDEDKDSSKQTEPTKESSQSSEESKDPDSQGESKTDTETAETKISEVNLKDSIASYLEDNKAYIDELIVDMTTSEQEELNRLRKTIDELLSKPKQTTFTGLPSAAQKDIQNLQRKDENNSNQKGGDDVTPNEHSIRVTQTEDDLKAAKKDVAASEDNLNNAKRDGESEEVIDLAKEDHNKNLKAFTEAAVDHVEATKALVKHTEDKLNKATESGYTDISAQEEHEKNQEARYDATSKHAEATEKLVKFTSYESKKSKDALDNANKDGESEEVIDLAKKDHKKKLNAFSEAAGDHVEATEALVKQSKEGTLDENKKRLNAALISQKEAAKSSLVHSNDNMKANAEEEKKRKREQIKELLKELREFVEALKQEINGIAMSSNTKDLLIKILSSMIEQEKEVFDVTNSELGNKKDVLPYIKKQLETIENLNISELKEYVNKYSLVYDSTNVPNEDKKLSKDKEEKLEEYSNEINSNKVNDTALINAINVVISGTDGSGGRPIEYLQKIIKLWEDIIKYIENDVLSLNLISEEDLLLQKLRNQITIMRQMKFLDEEKNPDGIPYNKGKKPSIRPSITSLLLKIQDTLKNRIGMAGVMVMRMLVFNVRTWRD